MRKMRADVCVCVYVCTLQGYSRLAVAYFGLKLYSDSVETYKKALELEPDDRTLQQGLQKV